MTRIWKTDPCSYLLKYSPDILKRKIKVLDTFITDKVLKKLYRIKSSGDKDPFFLNKHIPITGFKKKPFYWSIWFWPDNGGEGIGKGGVAENLMVLDSTLMPENYCIIHMAKVYEKR